jgi:hypothetical protein
MKFRLHLVGIALCSLALVACSTEESENVEAGSSLAPATEEERNILLNNLAEETVSGGTECLASPLVGTCFEVLYTACFQPEGECTEAVPTGTQNTWTWDNGSQIVYDYSGIDDTGANWLSAVTGYTPEGDVCFNGVLEIKGFENQRELTIQIGDTTLLRIDYNNSTDGAIPYTEYICGDGSFFQVPVDEMTLADACLFGPNAKACGFLKPIADEISSYDND